MGKITQSPAFAKSIKKTGSLAIIVIAAIIGISIQVTSCSPASVNDKNDPDGSKTDDFPRLIITRQNLDDLILKSKTTHKHLFDLTVRLADDFLAGEPPPLQNASNTYRRIGETMPSLGVAYLVTKENKYLTGAEKWIKALLDVPTWEGSANLGRSAWVTGIAQLYDWLYHDLKEDTKKRIIARLKEEAQIIMNTAASHRALSNHLLIETSAVGTTGLILPEEDPSRDSLLKQADEWTGYIIRNAPLDGSWGEGVQYWQYGLGYFLRFLEGAQTSGHHNYFPEYEWLKKTGRFPLHFSMPDQLTRVLNFGDCGTDAYIPACLLYLPASKYRDGVVQDFAVKIQAVEPHKLTWFDFLTFDATIQVIDYKTVEQEFHHFDDHGFVTMRSSWNEDATFAGFRCGPGPGHANQKKPDRVANRGFGPGHQHPDINNFVIYSNGTWLAIDPGYVQLKETRNYNTLLVNGYGQAGAGEKWLDYETFQSREPAPKIMLAESSPGFDYVIGNAGNIYVDEAGLEYFERQLMFVKPNLFIIADRLKARENSDYIWSLQANEIARIEKTTPGYNIIKDQASLSVFPLLPDGMTTEVTERMVEANDENGDPDYNESEALLKTIKIHATGVKTNFLVVLSVNKPGETRPDVWMDNGLIHIACNRNKYVINYQPDQELSEKILSLAGK